MIQPSRRFLPILIYGFGKVLLLLIEKSLMNGVNVFDISTCLRDVATARSADRTRPVSNGTIPSPRLGNGRQRSSVSPVVHLQRIARRKRDQRVDTRIVS